MHFENTALRFPSANLDGDGAVSHFFRVWVKEEKGDSRMSVKYIFVTGGVVSGLGKGITAASLGRLLKERGYRVTIQKFDPYINVDPGTMSPYQHGEVYVWAEQSR